MSDDSAIWSAAREGRLALRVCRSCAHVCHPPLPVCPTCRGRDWAKQEFAGPARLHAWCIVDGPGEAPARQAIIVAELAEGVRFVANLIEPFQAADLAEGLALRLCFAEQDGECLPMFRLAKEACA